MPLKGQMAQRTVEPLRRHGPIAGSNGQNRRMYSSKNLLVSEDLRADMRLSPFERFLPAALRFRRALAAHHAGRLAGCFTTVADKAQFGPPSRPLRIHFWTPHSWGSSAVHVERVLPDLRAQAAALDLSWHVTSGAELPPEPVDWLLCLKAVPPRGTCPSERTVLLLNDAAHRVWGHLGRFGHIVVVSSPALASLVGTAHPRVWFIEETEPAEAIAQGRRALDQAPPSTRAPVLLWHGESESLDGLTLLRDVLEAFARETDAEIAIVTNRAEGTEQWGALRVRYVAWSPEALATMAAKARLGIVPARPTLADSYLKSAGRLRRLLSLGCPAIGDARSPDVAEFSKACQLPAAKTSAEWLAALRQLWHDPVRLDEVAGRGHSLVSQQYSVARTSMQWLWFFAGGAEEGS